MANSGVDEVNVLQKIGKGIKDLGRTNIMVIGHTGVGKSTLINAMFKQEVAKMGTGTPVTTNIMEYPVHGTSVTLFDSHGLKMKEYKKIMDESCQFIQKRRNSKDSNEHIHIAWMCISQTSKHLEDGEIEFIQMLSEYMPVIIVITQSYDENKTLSDAVKQKFQKLKVISVVAREKTYLIGRSPISVMGLEDLVRTTGKLLPEARKLVFIAAQKVDLEAKKMNAQGIIVGAATAAAAAGAIPIPFSDTAVLVPIEVGMIKGITTVFGFQVEQNLVSELWKIFQARSGASAMGSRTANLLKFIPVVGSIAGGAMNAGIAASVTKAFGEAYIGIITMLLKEKNGVEPTTEELLEKCKQEWKLKIKYK